MFNSYSMSNIFLVSHVLLLMYFTRLNAPEIKRKNINSEPCYNLCVLLAPLLNLERKLWEIFVKSLLEGLRIVSKLTFILSEFLSKLINFYTPKNHHKTIGFVMISGRLEINSLEFAQY